MSGQQRRAEGRSSFQLHFTANSVIVAKMIFLEYNASATVEEFVKKVLGKEYGRFTVANNNALVKVMIDGD